MLSGDNGLLKRAGDARDETIVGQEKEQVELAYVSAAVKKLGSDVDKDDLQTELNSSVGSGKTTISTNTDGTLNVYFIDTEHNYNVNGGTVAKIEDSTIKITEFSISGTSVAEADIPVPTGFSHVSGTTKNSGYVIEDENGNQFVWVPVDKNQKITLKVSSEEDITEMKLYDPFGDEINLGTVSGKTYENTNIMPTVNGGYTVKITTANESKIKTIGVRSLYAIDTYSDFYGSDTYAKTQGYDTVEDMLQDLANSFEGDLQAALEDIGIYGVTTVEEYKIKCQNWMQKIEDTEDYKNKIETNGGFYVGRYEAGKENESLVIKNNKIAWTYLVQADALNIAKTYNSQLSSSLLTAAAWDRTLGWICETGNKTSYQICIDSSEWGNYSRPYEQANTGMTNKAVSNNIYDLAGNVYEWTTEVFDSEYTSLRGGGGFDGPYPAYGRNDTNFTNIATTIGFRVALYL